LLHRREFELFFPPIIFLFFSVVLIVVICLDVKLLESSVGVKSSFVYLINLGFDVSDDLVS
jgi:hypothetical protein